MSRHSEFHVTACLMDTASILQAVSTRLPRIALLSLNLSTNTTETVTILRRFHLSHPEIPKVLLVDTCDRELVVSALRSEGLGNREIARELNLSEHTIKKYLYRIFEKLGISSRVELVLYAVNNGDPRHAGWLAGTACIPPGA